MRQCAAQRMRTVDAGGKDADGVESLAGGGGKVASLDEGLSDRVRELAWPSSDRGPLMQTTGTRAAIGSLDVRLQAAEDALRDLALKVEQITEGVDPTV